MSRFKAFISYKHVASSRFAENLELALKSYAKPWLQRPPAIFRDEKYLKPGPDLPAMIERALDDSEFLIYLASPEAAASPWVERELARWCEQPGRLVRLILVVTRGTLATDVETGTIDWARTDVLPEALRKHLSAVPLYVDLSWAEDESRQTLLDPEFKRAVNRIVAALRRLDPIELSGQEVLQYRRNRRLRNAFVATIVLLALGIAGFASIAVNQARSASAQVSLVLTESARRAIADERFERAARLAALASRRGMFEVPHPAAEPTLAAAAQGSSLRLELRGHEKAVLGATMLPRESRLLTWSRDGTARIWDLATRAEIAILRHQDEVRGATLDPAGERVLSWSRDGTARIWDAATGAEIAATKHEAGVGGARFDATGKRVLSWDTGGVARVWDAGTALEIAATRHGSEVDGAIFDPTGERVLSWSQLARRGDGIARVWDAATGAEISTVEHPDEVWGARFDATGERVLSWGGRRVDPDNEERLVGRVRVWDAATGTEKAGVMHEYPITGAVFDPGGGRVLSWDQKGTARVWDAGTGAEIATVEHGGEDVGTELDATGQRVLSWSSDGVARVWELATGRELAAFEHQGEVWGATFDTTGQRVLSRSSDGVAQVWDAKTGEPIAAGRHQGGVLSASFDATGAYVLSRSTDGVAKVWDSTTAATVAVTKDSVRGATFVAERTLVSWSDDGSVRVSDPFAGAALHRWRHGGRVYGATFDPSGQYLLTWGDDGPQPGDDFLTWSYGVIVRVWDVASGKVRASLDHEGFVRGAMFDAAAERVLSSSNYPVKLLAADRGGVARVWDAATGAGLAAVAHADVVRGAAFYPSGKRVVSWGDGIGAMRSWDAATGAGRLDFQEPMRENDTVVFSAGGERVLSWGGPDWNDSASSATVRVWDTATGSVLADWAHETPFAGAVFDATGDRVVTWTGRREAPNDAGSAQVWDAVTGVKIAASGHRSFVAGATFDPAGERVLSWSADRVARVWDAATGDVIVELEHEGRVSGAAFDATGERVLSWGTARFDGIARLWSVATGLEIASWVHEDGVDGAIFGPAGRRVLSWGQDGVARVWDAATGTELAVLRFEGDLRHVMFDASGERVHSWSKDGTVRVWDVSWSVPRASGRALIAEVCARRLRGIDQPLSEPFINGAGETVRHQSVRLISAADAAFAPILQDRVGEDVCAVESPWWSALGRWFGS